MGGVVYKYNALNDFNIIFQFKPSFAYLLAHYVRKIKNKFKLLLLLLLLCYFVFANLV